MKNLINFVNEEMTDSEKEKIANYAEILAYNTVSPNQNLFLLKEIINYLAEDKIYISHDRKIGKQQKETIKVCKEIKEKMGW